MNFYRIKAAMIAKDCDAGIAIRSARLASRDQLRENEHYPDWNARNGAPSE